MTHDRDFAAANFISGFVLGALVGAGIALLTAPDSGRRTRKRIKRYAGDLKEGATDQLETFAGDVKARVDDALRGARKRLSR
ncbi:MAG: YtxH domain-containing protein [Gemmatimonadetes bacterium]|nr:MAG: YtxH domain-containing protein [Gemmatimonadota bacterium]